MRQRDTQREREVVEINKKGFRQEKKVSNYNEKKSSPNPKWCMAYAPALLCLILRGDNFFLTNNAQQISTLF